MVYVAASLDPVSIQHRCIIAFYADCDRRRPCGVRAETARDRDAARGSATRWTIAARTATPRSTIRRSAPTSRSRSRRASPTAASSSAGAARVSRWPPTRCRGRAPRSATISTRPACRARTTTRTSSRSAGASSAPGSPTRFVALWLATPFDGGRHQRRLDQIAELEKAPESAGSRSVTMTTTSTETPLRWRSLAEADPEIAEAIAKEAPPPEQRPRAHRVRELRQPGGPRSRRLGPDEQVRRRAIRASATTAGASSSTSPNRSPSPGRRRSSAPSTPTCSRIPARRRTWRCTSRC